jgi:hypothetical protein
MGTILFIGIALLACLVMTGATKRLPTLPKTEKILWTGYWDTGEWKDNNSYEYYCVVSEKKFLRTLTVFKQTAKEYKKIFSYSNYDGFIMAYSIDDKILFTYWSAGSLNSLRIFECDPVKDKVKMTFEKGFIDNPNEVEADDGTSYLIIKDVNTLGEQALSQMTAIFYRRVPGNGYSKITTCKWADRYLMMDTLSKQSTLNFETSRAGKKNVEQTKE